MKPFKFIDLFSGIGAFHIALSKLGGKCVFASEIDECAIYTYKKNFHMDSNFDITKVKAEDIRKHDVLCAGFPCQAFSNAGHKRGFSDTRGTLFFEIERILKKHQTKYVILENVKHLLRHDGGRTYRVIKEKLLDLGYILSEKPIVLSPHYFGIPQNRERVFILGVHKKYCKDKFLKIDLPKKKDYPHTSIYTVLDKTRVNNKYYISEYEKMVFSAWNDFIKIVGIRRFGFPIWIKEFGQTYSTKNFPQWKKDYCRKNREFYLKNKTKIDDWIKRWGVENFKNRDKKFEWQAGTKYNSIWQTAIQLRQSGIRCKKTDYFPALVAIVQTPIVGKYKRRITPREAARLQSFPQNFIINKVDSKAYKQFGNSANVKIIQFLAKQLLRKY